MPNEDPTPADEPTPDSGSAGDATMFRLLDAASDDELIMVLRARYTAFALSAIKSSTEGDHTIRTTFHGSNPDLDRLTNVLASWTIPEEAE